MLTADGLAVSSKCRSIVQCTQMLVPALTKSMNEREYNYSSCFDVGVFIDAVRSMFSYSALMYENNFFTSVAYVQIIL